MTDTKDNWMWWAGRDDELYSLGPFDTREEAFRSGQECYSEEGFHIVEAIQIRDVRLAAQFDAHDFLERVEDEACDEYSGPGGDTVFDMDVKQRDRMQVAVRDAIEAWQTAERLTFKSFMFQRQRNEEFIQPKELKNDQN